jgi:threonine/homoserine/homoserine lactone efflux protein
MTARVAAFAVLSLIVTVTPGPDSLLVLRSSLLGGRRAGARVAGGAASGSLA